jgi:hypothetical protein
MTDIPTSSELQRIIAEKRAAGWTNTYEKPDPPEGGTTELNLDDLFRAVVTRKDKP